jgi:hypothetical protein
VASSDGHGVFVAVLGVDAFTVGELDAQIEQTNIHKLWTQALQIDFHSRLLRIPNCDVAEEVEVEVRAQFVVQPDEDVLVKLFGDTLSVIVGRHQNGRIFHQVRAQQQSVSGGKLAANLA